MARNDHPQTDIIHEKFVNNKEDIEGHIAYSLYKSDKVIFLKEKRAPKSVTDYVKTHTSSERIRDYRTKATGYLNGFAQTSIDQVYTDDVCTAVEEVISKLAPNIADNVVQNIPKKDSVWLMIGVNVLSSIVFGFAISMASFIADNSNEDGPFNFWRPDKSKDTTIVKDTSFGADSTGISK